MNVKDSDCVLLQENKIFIINNCHIWYKVQYIFSLKIEIDLINCYNSKVLIAVK